MRIEVNKNAKRNIIVGIVNKFFLLLLPFVSKAVIKQVLGTEYLGLNSLFSSVLNVLLLSELGFSGAMVFHMYKPVAENDYKTLNALLCLYKKVYYVIGLVVVTLGIILIPFLRFIIKKDCPTDINIYIIFLIQLLNIAISYFLFGYRQSLLVAYQRDDIKSLINLFVQASMQIGQIIILLITKNYYCFIILQPLFTIIENVWIAYYTKKLFPSIRSEGTVDAETKQSIRKLVAGSFVQKACDTTRNSLDSICLSAFIGLAITGMYNNYYTIFNGITMVFGILIGSVTGGIGNHIVVKTKDENFDELKKMDMLYMMISGWSTVCLLCLSQSVMRIWMGEDMLLPTISLISMCIYFYTLKLGDVRCIYYTATGMWWEMRYRSIVETVANLVLNIVLGIKFGLNGIIWATTISLLLFNFTWGTAIIFKHYFGVEKIWKYYLYQLHYVINTTVISVIMFVICNKVSCDNIYLDLILKALVCGSISGLLFIIANIRNPLFKDAIKMVKKNK